MEVASNVSAELGLDLFRSISAATERTDNIFISTYGIVSALSLLMLGTKGKSEMELLSLLKISKDRSDAYHQSLSRLVASLTSPSLSSANRVFVQQNLTLVASYLQEAQRFYSAAAESVNFAEAPSEAQTKINDWVKQQTHDKIPQLLEEPLDPTTLVFLVNAVYFKDKWLHPFKLEHTYPGTFHVSAEESVKCDMMMLTEDTEEIRYGNSDPLDCQLVELPYQGEFSMLILLPFVPETLPEVEKKLTASLLRREMKNLASSPGMGPEIYLPRFKVEFEADLRETLIHLGVSSLFDETKADLKGIIVDADRNVAISKVIHKAVIEVNEEGTEAAAATGVGMVLMCMPPAFRMDHPFLYAIIHRPTDTPIFIGRLSRPPPATTGGP